MNIQDKQIAIIGGGPGGLTLANLLQQAGCMVKVYERDKDKDARVQGANLDLHEESGLKAMEKMGLLEAFYTHYLPDAGKLRVMDQRGNIYIDDHIDTDVNEHRPEIDRGPLRSILLENLYPDTVVWDSQYLTMKKENAGWNIIFKNGRHYYADIVIGADGANSKIRSFLTDIKPVYSGITIVEGNILEAEKNAPEISKILKGGKIFAFGNKKSIILSTKGDGSIAFYTGEAVSENWVRESGIDFNNLEDVKHWFQGNFSEWDNLYQELFDSKDLTVIPRPLYHYEAGQQWNPQANLTIIGDAAHRMPPYAGEGVNMAMLDALELSEELLQHKNIASAIASYEKRMLERADKITAITMKNTVDFHQENALQSIIELFQSYKGE